MGIKAVQAVGPFGMGAPQPVVHREQALEVKPRRATLAVPGPSDEAGPLQHLEVLGDGRLGQRGGFGELDDAGFSGREALEDRSASGVGKRREGGAEGVVTRHCR